MCEQLPLQEGFGKRMEKAMSSSGKVGQYHRCIYHQQWLFSPLKITNVMLNDSAVRFCMCVHTNT